MALNIRKELEAMHTMRVAELRAKYLELFGEPPRSRHRQHLVRRIAWRLQAIAEGDLTGRARRRAAELARETDLRLGPPPKADADATALAARPPARDRRLPMAGTLLVRQYHGQTLEVKVLEEGFEYDGQTYRSLTAVAKRITGRHWNGYHFFGLNNNGAKA
jgi:hypothetical protein